MNRDPIGEGWGQTLDRVTQGAPLPVLLLAVLGLLFVADCWVWFCWNVFVSPVFGLRPLDLVSALGLLGIVVLVVGVLVGLKSGGE